MVVSLGDVEDANPAPAPAPTPAPAPAADEPPTRPAKKAGDFWRNNGGFKATENNEKGILTITKGGNVWEFDMKFFPDFGARVQYGNTGVRPIKQLVGPWWAVATVKDGEPIIGMAAIVKDGETSVVTGEGGVIKKPGYHDIHWIGSSSPSGKAIDAFLDYRKGHMRVSKVSDPEPTPAPAPAPAPASFPDPKIEIPFDLARLLGNGGNDALIEAINKLTAEVARLNAKLARLAD